MIAKISLKSAWKQRLLSITFVSFAILILALDVVYFSIDVIENYTGSISQIIWLLVPAMEALIVVSALLMSLWKLRCFHMQYQISVNLRKIKIHVAICLLMFLIFFVRFFRSL